MPAQSTQEGVSLEYQVLPGNESVLMREAMQRRSWWKPAAKGKDTYTLWFGGNGQSFDFKLLVSSKVQIANRLENHREVCTKSGLATNLARIQTALKAGPLPWAPETYVLPGKGGADAYNRFVQRYKEVQGAKQGNTWIVKPVSLNRGNGIEVFNQCDDIIKFLESKKPQSKWIVQRYIERPALVQGRKFDIRAYVLVTPDQTVYMCKEAYVRTSSTPYKLDDLSDKSAHLTNDAVQKHLDTYHQFEDHCKMDMKALQEALPNIDIQGRVFPAMKDCVCHLFGMTVPNMNPRRLKLSWELLGLDFMIDEEGQVLLIEVNTSPALFRAGAYLTDLLPRVVEECVQKAIDPYFPPPAGVEPPLPLDNFEQMELVQFGSAGQRRLSEGSGSMKQRTARISEENVGRRSLNQRSSANSRGAVWK